MVSRGLHRVRKGFGFRNKYSNILTYIGIKFKENKIQLST